MTSDVVVSFAYIVGKEKVQERPRGEGLIGYEIIVTDRRDGKRLAKLRYFTELEKGRACGPTGTRVLAVQQFVLKAIAAR